MNLLKKFAGAGIGGGGGGGFPGMGMGFPGMPGGGAANFPGFGDFAGAKSEAPKSDSKPKEYDDGLD